MDTSKDIIVLLRLLSASNSKKLWQRDNRVQTSTDYSERIEVFVA